MVATILSILAYLIPWLIEVYQTGAPARTQEAKDAEIQKLRVAIPVGDVVAVNAAFDKLLSNGSLPATSGTADSSGRQHSDADTAKYLNDVLNS